MDDLLNEFLEEATDSLVQLDQDFVELEKDPENLDIVKNIFRVMHTVKGTSGFLGFSRLEKIAHAAEDLMDKVRSGDLAATPELISVIFEASDKIKEIVEALEEDGEEPQKDDSELISKIRAIESGGEVAEESSPQEEPANEEQSSEAAGKTPDLDEEIDFEPIVAEYVEEEDIKTLDAGELAKALKDEGDEEGEQRSGGKTPDLDEEIDFDPIMAEYADEQNEEGKENPDTPKNESTAEDSSLPVKKELSDEEKKKAVDAGLKAAASAEANKKPIKKPAQSIRVSLDVLENLMQLVGELVLTRNQLLQLKRSSNVKAEGNFATSLQRLNIITTELQEGVMKTRMQPISNVWAKFPRVVRDLAKELNKKIQLEMVGEETELDRQMLEAIKDPLTHMIRNAADHGVEGPEEREAAGKSEIGTVTLSAYHEGGHIIIKISDDGKGVNIEAVTKRIIDRELATPQDVANMTDREISQFIFKPGFSTAEAVTAVSGRGVGMDVVLSNIQRIGGTVEIDSVPGKGSEFLIKLPLTLAIMPVLIVKTASEIFAIPQIMVSEIVKAENKGKDDEEKEAKQRETVASDDVEKEVSEGEQDSQEEAEEQENSAQIEDKSHRIETINGSPVLRLRGNVLPLISLSDTLNLERPENPDGGEPESFVVVCEVGSSMFGMLVDSVFHTEEIVVKPRSKLLKDLDVYSGSTILGDGSVILILDANGLLRYSDIKTIDSKNSLTSEKIVFDREEIDFLMFKTDKGAPKAIPLELVSRLEEVDYSKAEKSGGTKVIQYRGDLMHIISIDQDMEVPDSGTHDTIVFADRNRVLGVYVNEIMDIIHQSMDVKAASTKEGILGSMIMAGQTTEVVDISHYLSLQFTDWLGHDEANKVEQGFKEEDRRHVLLVDDSAFFRKFMRPVILSAGYRVTTCEDGKEALDLLNTHSDDIDIVVTDIDMPIMNGLELVAAAKQIDDLKEVPFIALTSHEEKDFDQDIHELGFEELVTKSDRNKVIGLLKAVLEEKKIAL